MSKIFGAGQEECCLLYTSGKANADEIAKIKNGSTVVPKATDAATVSGHTVATNVPENAKFTDTVYTPEYATTSDIDEIITAVFG